MSPADQYFEPPGGLVWPAGEVGGCWFLVAVRTQRDRVCAAGGGYLVFASLIIPALATRHVAGRKGLLAAYAMAVAAFGLGRVLSALFDLPTGSVIIWSLAVLAVMMGALSHAKHCL